MERAVAKAERVLAMWHRVCGELDDGKKWEEIDNGFTPEGRKASLDFWTGYMRSTMYHSLMDVVLTYRHLQKPESQ